MRLEEIDEVVKSLKHRDLENMVKLFGKHLIPCVRLKPVYSIDYSCGMKVIFGAVCAELNKAFVFVTTQRYTWLPTCAETLKSAVSKKMGDASELACEKNLNAFMDYKWFSVESISRFLGIDVDELSRDVWRDLLSQDDDDGAIRLMFYDYILETSTPGRFKPASFEDVMDSWNSRKMNDEDASEEDASKVKLCLNAASFSELLVKADLESFD